MRSIIAVIVCAKHCLGRQCANHCLRWQCANGRGPAGGGDGGGGVPTFVQCFCRGDTLLLLFFMSTMNLKSSLYITTFAEESSLLFPKPAYGRTATALATTFNLAFPIGGFATSVFASLLLERLGEREDLYMLLVIIVALLFGMYNLLTYTAAQLASALLFGPTRTLQWACYFHLLSLPRRYPPQYVGRLLGYGNLLIALAGDVPIGLLNRFIASASAFGSETSRYLFVHGVLQLGLLAALALPWHLHRTLRTHRRRGAMKVDAAVEVPTAADIDTPSRQTQ